jgi:KipI family sensor histidine kinase inhibitor
MTAAEARDRLTAVVEAAAAAPPATDARRPVIEIPVRYGGEGGPDLDEVADRLSMTPEAVVATHSGRIYRVFQLGFVPGFAYLGILPRSLVLPRRATPRPHVPPGSVAIAGSQTAVYPSATPGGWHLLGRTDINLWDPTAEPPSRLSAGDRVRFIPVDAS